MDWEPAPVFCVRLKIKLLHQLLIEHPDKERIGFIRIRRDDKQGSLGLFIPVPACAQLPEMQFVRFQQLLYDFVFKEGKPCIYADDDALYSLEHLYNANAITGENVSASESKLADADMADEMVAFSRSQILEQANLAVMAQANIANQTVLKLVQG